MTGENLGSRFTALTGLSHFGTLFTGLVAAATTVGGIAIWGADQARKIDVSDRKTVELQQQIETLKSDLDKLSLTLKTIPTSSGSVGPPGPSGPRGEKGDPGEKGEPGKDGMATDASSIPAIVAQELKKLPAVGLSAASVIPMAEINTNCTVLKPKEDKFRLVFKKGMTFCLPDGELATKVDGVRVGNRQLIAFTNPGQGTWTCYENNDCQFNWLRSYSFHIEKFDDSGSETTAITVFKKSN